MHPVLSDIDMSVPVALVSRAPDGTMTVFDAEARGQWIRRPESEDDVQGPSRLAFHTGTPETTDPIVYIGVEPASSPTFATVRAWYDVLTEEPTGAPLFADDSWRSTAYLVRIEAESIMLANLETIYRRRSRRGG